MAYRINHVIIFKKFSYNKTPFKERQCRVNTLYKKIKIYFFHIKKMDLWEFMMNLNYHDPDKIKVIVHDQVHATLCWFLGQVNSFMVLTIHSLSSLTLMYEFDILDHELRSNMWLDFILLCLSISLTRKFEFIHKSSELDRRILQTKNLPKLANYDWNWTVKWYCNLVCFAEDTLHK